MGFVPLGTWSVAERAKLTEIREIIDEPSWTSDDSDAVERLKIQYGISIVYPFSAMGVHVSAVPMNIDWHFVNNRENQF